MGVDYAVFAEGEAWSVPTALGRIPHPRVGLVGRLNDRIDWGLMERLSEEHPGWHLVLVGPIYLAGIATRNALERLEARANVHLLPAVSRSEMPAYVAGLDVCLIPYRVFEGTVAINPIKLYEYLASGRPVVSTPLPAVLDFADLVACAPAETFGRAIEEALDNDTPKAAAARRARARELDWHVVAGERIAR